VKKVGVEWCRRELRTESQYANLTARYHFRNLGRFTRNWEDNIKMCLKGTGLKSVDWIKLTDCS
jgi:hypothetical protein